MASQKTPYLFLYARAYEDVKLVLAGWEATLLWPHILCLLKQRMGVLSDDECSPEFIAATLRCPVELATAGLDGIKRVGLLVEGSRTCPGGAGGSHDRSGWVTPSWDKWAVDRREHGVGRAKTTVAVPLPDRSGALPDRSGALPTVSPDNGELELELERENKNTVPTPRKRRAATVFKDDSRPYLLARALKEAVATHSPTTKTARADEKTMQGWARDLDKLLRIDGADPGAVAQVIRWAHVTDDRKFWRPNLLSGAKVRKHFDALSVQAVPERPTDPRTAYNEWMADWRASLQAFRDACRLKQAVSGCDGFAEWLPTYDRRALPIPSEVMDLIKLRFSEPDR